MSESGCGQIAGVGAGIVAHRIEMDRAQNADDVVVGRAAACGSFGFHALDDAARHFLNAGGDAAGGGPRHRLRL
mgnify:CR=1 FL=1